MSAINVSNQNQTSIGRVIRNTAVTFAISAVINIIISLIGTGVLGVDPTTLPMQIPVIISAAAAFLIAAGIVYYVITRVSKNPKQTWRIAVIVGLALSMIPILSAGSGAMPPTPLPEGMSMTFTPTLMLVLAVMHVASAAVAWVVMPRE